MIRVYKNRQACFYRRMSAARNGEITFTKVTSPKSIVSANSTTGAYKQPKNIVTFINYTEKARTEIYTYLNVHATPLDHWRFAPLQRLLR